MAERWRDIPGHEGLYEVSDRGCVRSLKFRVPRILKHTIVKSGHHRVSLYDGLGERRQAFVNWLVLEAFVGPRPEGMWACHEDDEPSNNALGNLRWDTPKSNMLDRLRNGKHHIGERNGAAVLDTRTVADIVSQVNGGRSRRSMALELGVNPGTVDKIMNGETWMHVTGLAKAGA